MNANLIAVYSFVDRSGSPVFRLYPASEYLAAMLSVGEQGEGHDCLHHYSKGHVARPNPVGEIRINPSNYKITGEGFTDLEMRQQAWDVKKKDLDENGTL
jgi:hypothetical protein